MHCVAIHLTRFGRRRDALSIRNSVDKMSKRLKSRIQWLERCKSRHMCDINENTYGIVKMDTNLHVKCDPMVHGLASNLFFMTTTRCLRKEKNVRGVEELMLKKEVIK